MCIGEIGIMSLVTACAKQQTVKRTQNKEGIPSEPPAKYNK